MFCRYTHHGHKSNKIFQWHNKFSVGLLIEIKKDMSLSLIFSISFISVCRKRWLAKSGSIFWAIFTAQHISVAPLKYSKLYIFHYGMLNRFTISVLTLYACAWCFCVWALENCDKLLWFQFYRCIETIFVCTEWHTLTSAIVYLTLKRHKHLPPTHVSYKHTYTFDYSHHQNKDFLCSFIHSFLSFFFSLHRFALPIFVVYHFIRNNNTLLDCLCAKRALIHT